MKTSDISVDYLGGYGNDNTVANAARVSFAKDASNYTDEQNEKLIRYLAKHKHTSPFNHAFLSFRVKAPIFVARQLVKHRFMPWNEESRRYVDEEPEFYIPTDWRAKADNVKQGSSDKIVDVLGMQGFFDRTPNSATQNLVQHSLDLYNEMLEHNVAPEMARMVLPQNTMTNWIWSGTLGAFMDMLKLRLDPHAQYESRLVAQQIAETVEALFPVSFKAIMESN